MIAFKFGIDYIPTTSDKPRFNPDEAQDILVILKDHNNADFAASIHIPILPRNLLFIDDFLLAEPNDNLLYASSTDCYTRRRDSAVTIKPEDILDVNIVYLKAYSENYNMAAVNFEIEGFPVLYNPYLDGGRISEAPCIYLPLLLNPFSIIHRSLHEVFHKQGDCRIACKTTEYGDGVIGPKIQYIRGDITCSGLAHLYYNYTGLGSDI